MPTVFWTSPDGLTEIIRHFADCFTLKHRGRDVMESTSFSVVSAYYWAEFV